jgi:hypothetical protein
MLRFGGRALFQEADTGYRRLLWFTFLIFANKTSRAITTLRAEARKGIVVGFGETAMFIMEWFVSG